MAFEVIVVITGVILLVVLGAFYENLRDIRRATEKQARLLEQMGYAQGWLRKVER